MSKDQKFYLDQLQARLEYYSEIGIENLAVRRISTQLEDAAPSSDSTTAARTPSHTGIADNTRSARTASPRERHPSLFETPFSALASAESLEEVRSDLGDCQRCKLCSTRTNIVFGSGPPDAQLVFVGEGPGADEDVQGLPFVGRAGQLLTKIIEAIQLKREEVYICNVVKCRPPGNRFPEDDEISACSPFLFRQLDSIRPKIICCLGVAAAQTVLHTKASIGKLRGRFHDYRGCKVMPTYHPSYLLRYPEAKRVVWEDMKKVRALLSEIG
jgi:DNA polymerase